MLVAGHTSASDTQEYLYACIRIYLRFRFYPQRYNDDVEDTTPSCFVSSPIAEYS